MLELLFLNTPRINNDINDKEINISENESAKQFLRRNGYKTVPQIFVSGVIEDTQIYVGDYEKLKESI